MQHKARAASLDGERLHARASARQAKVQPDCRLTFAAASASSAMVSSTEAAHKEPHHHEHNSFLRWVLAAASGLGEPAAARQVAPFAVAEAPSDVYPSDFHLVTRMKQEVTGKVCKRQGGV
jgi:hypothetical protein